MCRSGASPRWRAATPSFHPYSASLLADPGRASLGEARAVGRSAGPGRTRPLVRGGGRRRGRRRDLLSLPLLPDGPGHRRVAAPTILHPAAHDEPALRLPVFARVFEAADGLVFQTTAERRTWSRDDVRGRQPTASCCSGSGWTIPRRTGSGDARRGQPSVPRTVTAALPALPGPGRPSQGHLAAGRTVRGLQGAAIPVPSAWCSPGRSSRRPRPSTRTSRCSGRCRTRDKWALLRGARWPWSRRRPWEAFSLVVAEAWSARTPVLVNAGCAATVEHCRRSGGGLAFAGFGEFEGVVDRLAERRRAADDARSARSGLCRPVVPVARVIDRYAAFIESCSRLPVNGVVSDHRSRAGGVRRCSTTGTPSRLVPGRTCHTRYPPISWRGGTGSPCLGGRATARPGMAGDATSRAEPARSDRDRCRGRVVEGTVLLVVEHLPGPIRATRSVGEFPAGIAVDVAPAVDRVEHHHVARPSHRGAEAARAVVDRRRCPGWAVGCRGTEPGSAAVRATGDRRTEVLRGEDPGRADRTAARRAHTISDHGTEVTSHPGRRRPGPSEDRRLRAPTGRSRAITAAGR